ncbi:MAG: D-alanyl-lipoteichoic acid biosynthesis protein DltD [Raoultibacter sp.]
MTPAIQRLAAIVLAAVLVVGTAFAYDASIQTEEHADGKMYEYVYSREKSASTAFAAANQLSDSLLTFGTSDLYISSDIVPQVPRSVFGENNYGVDTFYIGEGYNQSLWQAIAAGAFAPVSPHKKVVFLVSPQWFFEGGQSADAFKPRFSYSLYRQFCANPTISDDTKDYVRRRVAALGIESDKIAAANRDTFSDLLNDWWFAYLDSRKIRLELQNVRAKAPDLPSVKVDGGSCAVLPDWDALQQQALADGQARCTNNKYGIYDDFWDKHMAKEYGEGKLKGWLKNRSFLKAPTEYEDLKYALSSFKESGLDPLVVILPVSGAWYDYEEFPVSDRQECYRRIRELCVDAGVTIADFTDREYDDYFLCDGTHLGWTGWVAFERAVYDFAGGGKG